MSSLYEIITEKILAQLDKGEIPWRKPWTAGRCALSHTSGKPYSLLNQIMLMDDRFKDLPSLEFITFNQLKKLGGSVRKGEKSKMVVFWKVNAYAKEKENEDGVMEIEIKKIPYLRYYNVWEVSQCEGVERKYIQENPAADIQPIEAAEAIVDDYFTREKVTLHVEDSDRAFYSPILDEVHIPLLKQFSDPAEYYSTLFHEMTHSTGHVTRLNRLAKLAAFGSEDYSKEELVAEMGAAYLIGQAGIDSDKAFSNSVAYIQGWSRKLREDSHLFVNAAAKAEAAVNYINNINKDNLND